MRPSSLILPLAIALVLGTAGCSQSTSTAAAPATAAPAQGTAMTSRSHDESSYAQPEQVVITDLALDLDLDFDSRQIRGTATYALDWKQGDADELVLDTRDLDIRKVEAVAADGSSSELAFVLAPADKVFGSRLSITTISQPAKVRITYATAPTASGLQWLEPSMTEGGKLPFMFSQSQAIHARSWVPLQDTPGVRFTYSATVRSRPDVMVLMSADNAPDAVRDGEYSFTMPQPIPSYLLAIAAGDLVFQPISPRSGIWAEPSMAGKAAKEFEDTEKMIVATEKLYGEYRWGRYDMLVLPPSFPFGGMENPRLTFATPTVITGDKSLVSLIAHELAHSWSGNLVTNSSWKDIWLNEGFTSYVQSRIIEEVYGREMAEMERMIDQAGLREEIAQTPVAQQLLALAPLGELDPDEALSSVPYDKGAWFLQFLEQRFGREVFDAFLRGWFNSHAFGSTDTDAFLAYLDAELVSKYPHAVSAAELDAWIKQPGIPDTAPKAVSRNFAIVDAARIALQGSGELPSNEITRNWVTQEWVHFITGLGQSQDVELLAKLDKAYQLTGTANGEIAMRWYPLAIRSGYAAALPQAQAFIEKVGRRKLIMPIYAELVKTPQGLDAARASFERARSGYHPITTGSVQALLAQSKPAS